MNYRIMFHFNQGNLINILLMKFLLTKVQKIIIL